MIGKKIEEIDRQVERKLRTTPLNRFVDIDSIIRSLKRDNTWLNKDLRNIDMEQAISYLILMWILKN